MNCIICNKYIGEQAKVGRKRKYCPECAKAIKHKAHNDWRNRVKLQGKIERPDKTDDEIAAIKAKYSDSDSLDYAIGKLADILSGVIVR